MMHTILTCGDCGQPVIEEYQPVIRVDGVPYHGFCLRGEERDLFRGRDTVLRM